MANQRNGFAEVLNNLRLFLNDQFLQLAYFAITYSAVSVSLLLLSNTYHNHV